MRNCRERLQRIFTEGFKALDIAEPLFLAAAADAAPEVLARLRTRKATHAGILLDGAPAGFAAAEDLGEGDLASHLRPFEDVPLLSEEAPLGDAILAVEKAGVAFVLLLGRPTGVITKRELEKAPVRMWLFGSITLIEMAVTQAVRNYFPGDRWMALLPEGRLQLAMKLWGERQRRDQNAEVLDCVQLADKVLVILKDKAVRTDLGFTSRREAERMFKGIQSLRNNLAHVQPIAAYDWVSMVLIASRLDVILGLLDDERYLGVARS